MNQAAAIEPRIPSSEETIEQETPRKPGPIEVRRSSSHGESSSHRDRATRREMELLETIKRQKERAWRLRRQRDLAVGLAALTIVVAIASWLIPRWIEEAGALYGANTASTMNAAEPPRRERDSQESPARGRSIEEEVTNVISSWSGAWSSQDIEPYLDFYSSRFELPPGMSRSSWEYLRRVRIMNADAKSVSDLEVVVLAPGSARVRFLEAYRSPHSVESVPKTMDLVKESGRWRILSERTAPPS
ncbi:MAG: hypothetical protein GY719_27765 [bacterium]|nr:hypothetical protein [bacterium]